MNKKIISASLAAFVALGCTLGCKGKSNNDGSAAVKGDVKLYTDGMAYSQSAAREEKEVYSLYYEYLGGAGVMPIGGFYVPHASGGSTDGNAKPEGTAEEILAAGKRMYHELSPETAEFIDAMFDMELFDVLSKPGKAPGGYCTDLPKYKMPFIFSNFNGTSGDVDVLTHEAGHAFNAYRVMRKDYPMALMNATMETCECHSMSMEFLTQDYHKYFFGAQTAKYEQGHCDDALMFIPYGCMVDEFQHLMYENENLTPDERNETWLRLEKKYRPWIDFDNLPFYSRGGGWQQQLHIYLYPLYYIDYCMAQTVAFQFWIASMHDRTDAWERYMRFVDAGGSKTFVELCHDSGIKVPYEPGCIREIGSEISQWLHKNARNH